jgi:hypothetical protein
MRRLLVELAHEVFGERSRFPLHLLDQLEHHLVSPDDNDPLLDRRRRRARAGETLLDVEPL